MLDNTEFDLQGFLPYLLNQAAEVTSLEFQKYYKDRYGMLQTEWRVLFHLGRYGAMPAKEICARAKLHKTKVSRAVSALAQKRFLSKETVPDDRRHETLALTRQGQATFTDLTNHAQRFDERLTGTLSVQEQQVLRKCLTKFARLGT